MRILRSAAALGLMLIALAAAFAMPTPRRATVKTALDGPRVTYAKDVAPILYENCAGCHHAGEVAPFALTSYADAKPRAQFLAAVTQSHYMPPWHADRSVAFQDERGLSETQIATLQKWADEGAPLGNPQAMPPAPHYASGWTLGPPDMEFAPPAAYHLPADGSDVYRCFVIPTHFDGPRWVTAIQVQPGNARVVHHIIVFTDTSGRAAAQEAATHDGNPGYTSFGGADFTGALGGWAPGNEPHPLPPGVGIELPQGSDIVLQVHYHKDGKPETDLSRIGLYFSKVPVDQPLHILPLFAPLHIPAGDAHYVTQQDLYVPLNATLLAIMPHMHLLGQTMDVTDHLTNGKTIPLIHVPNWDFNWQTTYFYKQPLQIPQGSTLHLTATYDNSANNPRNPNNPPKDIGWGEQTSDEMCIAFLFFTINGEHLQNNNNAP